MRKQLTFVSRELPPPFETAWSELEKQHGKHDTIVVDTVVIERGRTTIAIRVNGVKYAVVGRDDLELAARELFHQVYGSSTTAGG